jgi:drug/metabolite transporter (DMT)-like permease
MTGGLNESMPANARRIPIALGIACGVGAAVFWAVAFVAVRHGLDVGFAASDIVLHRFVWSAILLMPLFIRNGVADLNGVGWTRGIALTILGGPLFAFISYSGFLIVPLGHGGVIQPSCAALSGLLLATLLLREPLPTTRAIGALIIVLGLAAIGGEAVSTIGTHGVLGDLMFVLAGTMFGTFGALLRLWRIDAIRGTVVVGILSAVFVPIHALVSGFDRIIALGLKENLIQAVAQGVLAGPGAIYLFVRSIQLLGAGRASVFPSLVPGITLLIGYLVLGEVPTVLQLVGFAVVLIGFRLAQKS